MQSLAPLCGVESVIWRFAYSNLAGLIEEQWKRTQISLQQFGRNIIETLRLLASSEKQNAYPVPEEWFCFWFDDDYHPDSPDFARAFSALELGAPANINRYFEIIANEIGRIPATPREIYAIPLWKDLMFKAKDTLSKLEDVKPFQ
jgi:hypothetical protein